MANLEQKFTGDASQLQAEIAKLQNAHEKLLGKMQQLTDTSKKGAKESAGAMRELGEQITDAVSGNLQDIGAMAAGFVSVRTAVELVNDGLQNQIRLRKEAQQQANERATSQSRWQENAAGLSRAESARGLQEIAALNQRSGFGDVVRMENAGAALLGPSGGSVEKVLKTLAVMAPIYKNNPGGLDESAATVAALSQTIRRDPMQAFALSQSAFAASSLGDQGAFRHYNMGVSLADATDTGKGDDSRVLAARRHFAIATGLGTLAGDTKGETSKMAMLQLTKQLSEFMPEKDLRDGSGKLIRKGTGMTDAFQRFDALQADPARLDAFVRGSKKDKWAGADLGQYKSLIEQTLSDRNSEGAKLIRENFAKITPDEERVKELAARMTSATPELETASVARGSAANTQEFLGMRMQQIAAKNQQALDILTLTRKNTSPSFLESIFDAREITSGYRKPGETEAEFAMRGLQGRLHVLDQMAAKGDPWAMEKADYARKQYEELRELNVGLRNLLRDEAGGKQDAAVAGARE